MYDQDVIKEFAADFVGVAIMQRLTAFMSESDAHKVSFALRAVLANNPSRFVPGGARDRVVAGDVVADLQESLRAITEATDRLQRLTLIE